MIIVAIVAAIVGEFMVRMDTADAAARELGQPRLQRAIGVVYRPGTERRSHYFPTRAADQFDAVIHLDRTTALEPLEPTSRWSAARTPPDLSDGFVTVGRPATAGTRPVAARGEQW